MIGIRIELDTKSPVTLNLGTKKSTVFDDVNFDLDYKCKNKLWYPDSNLALFWSICVLWLYGLVNIAKNYS